LSFMAAPAPIPVSEIHPLDLEMHVEFRDPSQTTSGARLLDQRSLLSVSVKHYSQKFFEAANRLPPVSVGSPKAPAMGVPGLRSSPLQILP